MSFEDHIAALEECLRLLESGELSLEASVEAYERGNALIKALDAMLAETSGRLQKLGMDGSAVDMEDAL